MISTSLMYLRGEKVIAPYVIIVCSRCGYTYQSNKEPLLCPNCHLPLRADNRHQ